MKIRAITLNNVRRFTDPAMVSDIGDGLNVLCEPNEHGKSTLFDAIQALFFKPYGSRDKDIVALRPHAGGAPEVTIEVETEAGRFTVFKRWFQKPLATVHSGARLVAQADAAEAWIGELLGGDAGGPSGLIWVRQGMTALTGGSTKEEKQALEARRDLMTSVGAEVEAMTGGRRMDKALARCREELGLYATNTGRARTGGLWKEAQDRVAALSETRDALRATAAELHDALAERQRSRRALRELEAPEASEDRRQRLETARAAHAAAARHTEEVEALARAAELARLNAQHALTQQEGFQTAQAEREAARSEVARVEAAATAARSELTRCSTAQDSADSALRLAHIAVQTAQEHHNSALRARAAREGADRRQALETRIAQAEEARARMEAADAAARSGPDNAGLQQLETLAAEAVATRATRDATAPQVIAYYAPDSSNPVLGPDGPLEEGIALPLHRAIRLTLAGIGALEVLPGAGGADIGATQAAEERLRTALDKLGLTDLDSARSAATARAEAQRAFGASKAVLDNIAPEGLAPLRAALAAIPIAETVDAAPDLDSAQSALQEAQKDQEAKRATRDSAAAQLAEARTEAARAETLLTTLKDRLTRAETQLAKLGDLTPETLAAEVAQTAAALASARAAHAKKAESAPDLASLKAALDRAQSVEAQARDEIARLHPLLARLNERISRASGDAVEERLAETTQELQVAEATLGRIDHEVAVLTRLEAALQSARNEARDRYFAPIVKELKPLLHLLWPDAELTWGEESLLPNALIRDGHEEPIDILSGGTQEQIALMVRLAFAQMLARAGRIAPVILDDALVYTDDDRIERMFDALHRQSSDLQIIVLTCRQRAFRALGGQTLRLRSGANPAGSGPQ